MTLSFVTEDTFNPEITLCVGQGYFINEAVSEGMNLSIPSAVFDDMEAFISPTFTGSVLWSAYVQVTDFNPEFISSVLGDPIRYRFGSCTHQSRGSTTSYHYLSYVNQAFPRQGCLFVPPLYSGVPFTESALPSQQELRLLIPVLQSNFSFTNGPYTANDFGRENGGLFGATDFRLILEPSVICNVTIAYFATCPINQTTSGDVGFFNI